MFVNHLRYHQILEPVHAFVLLALGRDATSLSDTVRLEQYATLDRLDPPACLVGQHFRAGHGEAGSGAQTTGMLLVSQHPRH